nr:hypothetical protein [Tanacetum cinerariifolium]
HGGSPFSLLWSGAFCHYDRSMSLIFSLPPFIVRVDVDRRHYASWFEKGCYVLADTCLCCCCETTVVKIFVTLLSNVINATLYSLPSSIVCGDVRNVLQYRWMNFEKFCAVAINIYQLEALRFRCH